MSSGLQKGIQETAQRTSNKNWHKYVFARRGAKKTVVGDYNYKDIYYQLGSKEGEGKNTHRLIKAQALQLTSSITCHKRSKCTAAAKQL